MIDAVIASPVPRPARQLRRARRARLTVLLLAGLMACSLPQAQPQAQSQVRLPALGETASEVLTMSDERRIGEQIMRQVRRDPAYLDDPVLVDYLQSLWQPLVAAARSGGDIAPDSDHLFAWEAFLVLDRSVNAFALPGGFVGVHLGLIALTASSDELASVLAHELAHVTQRHIARGFGNSQRANLISIAGLLLGVLAASQGAGADVANAAIAGGQAAAIQGQLNFSRDMEREADRIGFGLLSGAGYSPAGMGAMFEKMDNANRLNDNNAFPYLRTHPLTVERVAEARARLLLPGVAPVEPTLRHRMMQARARVLMDATVQPLRRQQAQIDAAGPVGPEAIAMLYGGALASALLRDHAQAEQAAAEALRRLAAEPVPDLPAQRELLLLLAQVQTDAGNGERALRTLAAPGLDPSHRAVLLLRARAAVAWHRADAQAAAIELRRSVEALQTWTAEHPQDASAWAQLAANAEGAGLELRALRANAEARAAVGDLGGAIDRLRAGQALVRSSGGQDHIEASVIDARLRQLEGERRLLAAEMRGQR